MCTAGVLLPSLTALVLHSRDEVDSSHYPVFHQMEGVKLFTNEDYGDNVNLTEEEQVQFIEGDLKRSLEGMAHALFGDVVRAVPIHVCGLVLSTLVFILSSTHYS